MTNSDFMTVRRKLAIASWTTPTEGNIYGKLVVDASSLQRYADHVRETTGEKVTVTHLVGKACALAMAQAPSLNGRIFLGRFIPHSTVDITFLVTLEGGSNLAKAKVEGTDKKSVADIARELREMAERLRQGKDDQFKKSQGPLHVLPTWLIRPIVWLTGWLTGALGIEVKVFGLERFPFGSLVVTNVGVFGLDEGYAPQTPFARVPVWVLVGAIKKQPVVVDDQVVVRPLLPLMATLDHRFVDGAQLGTMARTLRDVLENPWKLDGLTAPPWEQAQLPPAA
jgi:pyruvate dehydrogenase E2 component (dihydrolipoamide acetyltransferase)